MRGAVSRVVRRQCEEADGRTTMLFTWAPEDATEAEIACFSDAMKGLDQGWSTGMDLLAEILAELQAALDT